MLHKRGIADVRKSIKVKIEQTLKAAFFIGLTITATVLMAFIANFHDREISNLSAHWGEFGDYFGGTLNPIFSLFSFIALLITIRIQTIQLQSSAQELQLSREELKLTREELTRSADAQNQSQLALNKQAEIANKAAELNTINFLINIYRSEFIYLQDNFNQSALDKKATLKTKILRLENIIDETFDNLVTRSER